ncbi:hypothetical protein Tco_1393140 [Tanacetum coccineum]
MDKHGHGNQKNTKEAKDSKSKPRKVNYGQASVKSGQTVKESQTLVNRSQPLEDKNPNEYHQSSMLKMFLNYHQTTYGANDISIVIVGQIMQKKEEERRIVEEQAAKEDMSIEEMRHEQ